MRVVIAGASGFMGTHFTTRLREQGNEVLHIGRSAQVRWGETAAMTDLLAGADLLVNLAGKSVNCRYDAANRAEILHSRTETTRELADAVRACDDPPPLWINSSSATIYRHADDRPMTESTGELGTGFSVEIAKAWEHAFFDGELPATRRVALRTAIVLGDGGALVPMLRLARFGLGGPSWMDAGSAPEPAVTPVPSTSFAPAAAARSSPGSTWATFSASCSSSLTTRRWTAW